MDCPGCRHENRDTARFCEGCGAALSRTCASCGHQLRPGAVFCDACGATLEPLAARPQEGDPAPPETVGPDDGERRQLTVMFCDLVGSSRLAQQLDAEAYRVVVQAYQARCADSVSRYDGHIAQYLGDGVLVYFGYPQAHEDDAGRAVRAGRDMLREMRTLNTRLEAEHGVRLAIRVAVHTGPVVVGEVGSGEHRETLALGDTTNIAARLEGVAEPDSLVISHATLRLVAGLFLTEDLGTPPMKGIEEPVRVYRVEGESGMRSRLDLARSLTPFVGREQELGLLLDRWQQARDEQGQAVLISGEAGIGKSRLTHRLRERLADTPHTWLECRCSPYTRNSALYPVIELVQQALGFTDEESSEERVEQLEAGFELVGLEQAEAVPLLASLLSLRLPERYPPLELEPQLQKEKTLEALCALLLGLGERQPVVLLAEDLHWADPTTLELLGLLIEQSPTARILELLTFRPEFQPPWPPRGHVLPIALNRLNRDATRRIVAEAISGAVFPGAVVDQIVVRSDGVPLFVEELAKGVLESGRLVERDGRLELEGSLSELEIPATLQDSLMARLDRLGDAKAVAQLGAVLGREFSYALLQAVATLDDETLGEGLAQLVQTELLYQRGAPPRSTYTFKHALVQNTAYQSLLESRRRELHGRIADMFKQRFPERVSSEPELMARHCEEAGRTTEAIDHYRRAGDRASQRSANEEASIHLGRALDLLRGLPDTPARARSELALQVALGVAFQASRGFGAPEVEGAYLRARSLCERVEEPEQVGPALFGLFFYYISRFELEVAQELADELLARAKRAGDPALQLQGHHAGWMTQFSRGDLAATLAHVEQGLEIYQPEEHHRQTFHYGNHDPAVCAHMFSAWSLLLLGHPERAQQRSREALDLARELEHPMTVAIALMVSSFVENHLGRAEAAEAHAVELIDLSDERGFPPFSAIGAASRGAVLTARKEFAAGLDALAQGEAVSRAVHGLLWPFYLAPLLERYVRAQRPAEGLSVLAHVRSSLEAVESHAYRPELERLEGELLLLENGAEDAASQAELRFRRALDQSRRTGARWLELRAATSLARLLQQQGKPQEARTLLAPVYDWFTEGFDTPALQDAKALLDELV